MFLPSLIILSYPLYTHTHTHTRTHARTYTRTHAHTHARTHTHNTLVTLVTTVPLKNFATTPLY